MDLGPFFVEFAVAAAIGGLIGVEREHRTDAGTVIAGVRTFPLVSISGFLLAFLAQESGSPFVLAAGVVGAFAMGIMVMHVRVAVGQTGLTTPVALLITFLLGVVVGYGYTFEAVVIGVVATFLLLTKKRLHRFAQYLDEDEILSALQLITVLFIFLPLTATLEPGAMGQQWIGRGALVDPFLILLVVVFVSTTSFASLLVMRYLGARRGMAFTGLLGGLVNSEATTASLAQRAVAEPQLVRAAVVGSLLASTTMLARNLAIGGFADPSLRLLVGMAPFVVPMMAAGAFVAWRIRPGRSESEIDIRVKNPFAVLPALRFALVFAGISIVAALAQASLGEGGVYVVAIGGFVSAGAVVASMGSLFASGAVPFELALRTALLATTASIVGKLVILRATNAEAYQRALVPYAAMSGVALAASAVAFFV